MYRVIRQDAAVPTAAQRTILFAPGRRMRWFEPTVIPGTAKGLVGVSFGPDGDVIPLQNESIQQYTIEGDDQVKGLYLALISGAPTGVVVITIDAGPKPE